MEYMEPKRINAYRPTVNVSNKHGKKTHSTRNVTITTHGLTTAEALAAAGCTGGPVFLPRPRK